MKLKFYDWFVFAFLAAMAVSGGSTVALLAVIAGLLYLFVRRYFSGSKPAGNAISPPLDNEFVVHDSDKDGIVDRVVIELDVDLNYHPAPGHFRLHSQFDLASGKYEYEYKVEGTSVSIRLLNSYDDGEMANFKKDWKVRDGVVLESDLRARLEAKKFKFGSVDKNIAELKSQTEWHELSSLAFNGFRYFLLKRSLPAPDARRYLRQEVERLKLGMAKATQEYAAYGVEPDPNPESIDGWKWIGGEKSADAKDTKPFWDRVNTGTLGITSEEVGRYGRQLILDLQKLLGE
jgi:hypothetical protein